MAPAHAADGRAVGDGGPAAAVDVSGDVHVLVRGPDGRLWHAQQGGAGTAVEGDGAWSAWSPAGNLTVAGNGGLLVAGGGGGCALALGADRAVWHAAVPLLRPGKVGVVLARRRVGECRRRPSTGAAPSACCRQRRRPQRLRDGDRRRRRQRVGARRRRPARVGAKDLDALTGRAA